MIKKYTVLCLAISSLTFCADTEEKETIKTFVVSSKKTVQIQTLEKRFETLKKGVEADLAAFLSQHQGEFKTLREKTEQKHEELINKFTQSFLARLYEHEGRLNGQWIEQQKKYEELEKNIKAESNSSAVYQLVELNLNTNKARFIRNEEKLARYEKELKKKKLCRNGFYGALVISELTAIATGCSNRSLQSLLLGTSLTLMHGIVGGIIYLVTDTSALEEKIKKLEIVPLQPETAKTETEEIETDDSTTDVVC